MIIELGGRLRQGMNYAFLDEFGGVGKAIASEPYLFP